MTCDNHQYGSGIECGLNRGRDRQRLGVPARLSESASCSVLVGPEVSFQMKLCVRLRAPPRMMDRRAENVTFFCSFSGTTRT